MFSFREILVGGALAVGSLGVIAILGEGVTRAALYFQTRSGTTLESTSEAVKHDPNVSLPLGAIVRKSPFPEIIYQLRPNLTGKFQGQPLETNSWGMRDRPYEQKKAPGTYRIVALGDSIMFGWGVRLEDTYLKRVEARLNAKGDGKKYEILNFAVPGYNTAIEAELLDKVARHFEPDLILVQFVVNDFDLPSFLDPGEDLLTLEKSYLFKFVTERMSMALGKPPAQAAEGLVGFDLGRMSKEQKKDVLGAYKTYVGSKAFKRSLTRIVKIGKELKAPVVVIYATLRDGQRNLLERMSRKLSFNVIPVKPFVDRYTAERGIANDPEARRKEFSVAPGDPHPNAIGHGIYADALFHGLQGLL